MSRPTPPSSDEEMDRQNASYSQQQDSDLRKMIDSLLSDTTDEDQRELNELPGQRDAAIANLRARILDHYRTPGGFTVGEMRDHLHFLYLTHSMRKSDEELYGMAVIDSELRLIKPHIRDIYLPGIPPLGPASLLHPQLGKSNHVSHSTLPSTFSASILHPALLEGVPNSENLDLPVWQQWLCTSLGVKPCIPIVVQHNRLSDAFLYVSTHQPEFCLPLLQQQWPAHSALSLDLKGLRQTIRDLPVLTLSGQLRPLSETYLPLSQLLSHFKRLTGGEQEMPFLKLPPALTDDDLFRTWSWLCTEFNVGFQDDIGFLLDVLGCARDGYELSKPQSRKVMDLYCEIESQCLASREPDTIRGIVSSYLADIHGVMGFVGGSLEWLSPSMCSVNAALGGTKIGLMSYYESELQCTMQQRNLLRSFFSITLGIES